LSVNFGFCGLIVGHLWLLLPRWYFCKRLTLYTWFFCRWSLRNRSQMYVPLTLSVRGWNGSFEGLRELECYIGAVGCFSNRITHSCVDDQSEILLLNSSLSFCTSICGKSKRANLVVTSIWLHAFFSAKLYNHWVDITSKVSGSFYLCYCRKGPGITWIIVIDLVQQVNVKEKWLITGVPSPIPFLEKLVFAEAVLPRCSFLELVIYSCVEQCVHGCQSQWVASCGTPRWALCENEGIYSE
jgi:hypothetical protein